MSKKKQIRLRRAKRTTMHIRQLQVKNPDLPRLIVHKTPRHFSAQLIVQDGLSREHKVLVSVSTHEKAVRGKCKYTGNVEAATYVGTELAKRAAKAKIPNEMKVAFDRAGFKYHGRVKAFADAAREAGLVF